ncbi:MAG: sigma-70 family RNA polymerase sigma factor [Myxococcota bacterium]
MTDEPRKAATHDIEELYRVYGPTVLRRGRRLLPPAEAEELVQDVFLKLLERPSLFRGESSPSTWLYRVTTRLCLDRLRNRSRQTKLIVRHGPTMFAQSDSGGTPEARAFLDTLWRTLDEELAMIGMLYYIDGLTTADIGKTLGVSDRTIANRLAALTRIARQAAGESDEKGGAR